MFDKLYNYYNSLYDLILKKTCKKQKVQKDIENEEDGVFHFIELDIKAASKGVLFSVGVLLKKDKDGEQKEIQISTEMYKHSTELDRLALEGVASLYGLKVVEVMEAYEVEALNAVLKKEQQESTVQ